MNELIQDGLMAAFRSHPDVVAKLAAMKHGVETGAIPASAAAEQLLEAFGVEGF